MSQLTPPQSQLQRWTYVGWVHNIWYQSLASAQSLLLPLWVNNRVGTRMCSLSCRPSVSKEDLGIYLCELGSPYKLVLRWSQVGWHQSSLKGSHTIQEEMLILEFIA